MNTIKWDGHYTPPYAPPSYSRPPHWPFYLPSLHSMVNLEM